MQVEAGPKSTALGSMFPSDPAARHDSEQWVRLKNRARQLSRLEIGIALPQLSRQVEPFEFELSGVQLDSPGGPAQRELRFIEPVPADDRFRVDSLKAGRRPTQRSGYQRGGQRRATIERSGLPCSNSRALISWISIRC